MIEHSRPGDQIHPDGPPANRVVVAGDSSVVDGAPAPYPPVPTCPVLPRSVRALHAIVVTAAVAVVGYGLLLPVTHPDDEPLSSLVPLARLGIAAGLMAIAQLARLRLRVGSGTINVAWGEAALIIGLYLVPAGWLPAAVFVGTGVAVLLISVSSDRRSAPEIAYVAGSLTLATGLACVVVSAIRPAYGAPLRPELALALAAGALAYLAVTALLVSAALALRYGLPFHTPVLRMLHGKMIMFVGNIIVGLSVIGFLEHDARWLGLLPPALWLLQQTYVHRLRASDERRAWHLLAEATGALNQLDERGVAHAGARGALTLFGAERVEVDVLRGDGLCRRYSLSAASIRQRNNQDGDPGGERGGDAGGGHLGGQDEVSEADVVPSPTPASKAGAGAGAVRSSAGYDRPPGADLDVLPSSARSVTPARHVDVRQLTVGGMPVGELRVHYPPSILPTPRERLALQTFGDALGAALHDAATHQRLQALEAQSSYDAVHDPLTGLINRASLLTRGDARMRMLPVGQPVALLLLDVNHFKEVNDTLGHAAGDELLQEAGRRLRDLCQPGELLARLGGDEFALFIAPDPVAAATGGVAVPEPYGLVTPETGGLVTPEPMTVADCLAEPRLGTVWPVESAVAANPDVVPGPGFVDRPAPMAVALRRARQITERLAVPTEVAGVQLSMEASVGVVVVPAGAADMTELLRRADIAMYQAKDGGGNVAWYDSARDAASTDQLALLAEMREALTVDDQLVLALQPAVDLSTGAPTGVEALIRWRHPRRGALNPGDFVRAVEGSELLPAFTRYVVDKALSAAAEWARHGVPVPISVNVSARSLLDPRLPTEVSELLRRHQVPPHRLVLEITETVVMSEMEVIDEVLAGLRATGVQLAVDDFGTGFSSLTFLTRVTVDELKVDRAFVARMVDSPEAAAIVRTTVDLARSLNLRVVAEGVETADQRAALAALGCTSAQGYHFFRPMPADKVIAVLRSLHNGAHARVFPLRADGAS